MNISNELNSTIEGFLKFYEENKFKPELAQLTDHLLLSTLSARGYNNYRNDRETGEDFFINKILVSHNPKLCIDIGANIGDYSVNILRRTSSNIIAFEPLPSSFVKLQALTNEYGKRLTVVNKGVGAINENKLINYNENAVSHASFSLEVNKVSYVNNWQAVLAKIITLDAYCEINDIKKIDLVKIDVEGFESEVFEGAKDVFLRLKPRFVQMEFNWHQLFRNNTLNYFAEQLPSYDLYQLLPGGWIKRDPLDPLTNIFLYSNFVFVSREAIL